MTKRFGLLVEAISQGSICVIDYGSKDKPDWMLCGTFPNSGGGHTTVPFARMLDVTPMDGEMQ